MIKHSHLYWSAPPSFFYPTGGGLGPLSRNNYDPMSSFLVCRSLYCSFYLAIFVLPGFLYGYISEYKLSARLFVCLSARMHARNVYECLARYCRFIFLPGTSGGAVVANDTILQRQGRFIALFYSISRRGVIAGRRYLSTTATVVA